MIKTKKQAEEIAGTLSRPSKMPCFSYSIPAEHCITGAILRNLGEGTTCSKCYAFKGRYSFENVKQAMLRRAESLKDPHWVEAMVFMIKRTKNPYFRWHDSGDLQGIWHMKKIAEVAEQCPEVKFWLPTRELKFVRQYKNMYGELPENLTVRVSDPFLNMERGTTKDFVTSAVGDVRFMSGTACESNKRDNHCGDCRACWDKSVKRVVYPLH